MTLGRRLVCRQSLAPLTASGKHFINDVEGVVERGLLAHLANDERLRLIESEKGQEQCSLRKWILLTVPTVLYLQPDLSKDKVHLISGGGSGHEPAHAGYVGDGMLDICVAGNIFASPSASQILVGLESCPSKKGCAIPVSSSCIILTG